MFQMTCPIWCTYLTSARDSAHVQHLLTYVLDLHIPMQKTLFPLWHIGMSRFNAPPPQQEQQQQQNQA